MHYELFKRFLNSVKEILALVVVCVRKGAFKLFKQVFLLLGKVLRNFYIDVNILVAAVGAVDLLHIGNRNRLLTFQAAFQRRALVSSIHAHTATHNTIL